MTIEIKNLEKENMTDESNQPILEKTSLSTAIDVSGCFERHSAEV